MKMDLILSDTGVMQSCAWGAEDLSLPERDAKILNAGTDMVSGESDPTPFLTAIKEGLVSKEIVDRAVVRLLKELFVLGLFENPYVDEEKANALVNTAKSQEVAYEAHQKSVVLLKNRDNLLPLTKDKLAGKKVYVEMMMRIDYSEKKFEGWFDLCILRCSWK
ncbi:MAG: hypothetical protein ACI4C1_01570 [Lachnospiraceae bacterium]